MNEVAFVSGLEQIHFFTANVNCVLLIQRTDDSSIIASKEESKVNRVLSMRHAKATVMRLKQMSIAAALLQKSSLTSSHNIYLDRNSARGDP